MQILKRDLRHGEVTIKITDQEDLWHLSHVVEYGNLVKGQTERKIKIGNDENAKTVRKKVFLALEAEKIEYEPEHNSLRILGRIKEGPDDLPMGTYHSFALEENDVITIIKEKWAKYEIERLEEAEKPRIQSLLVLFDREEALFAILSRKGYRKILELKGDVQKKADDEKKKSDFYSEIFQKIDEHDKKEQFQNIVLASPAFYKEYLYSKLTEQMRKKTLTATISDVNDSAVEELIKKPELSKMLSDNKNANELKEIDELLGAMREDKAFYGFEDSQEKILMGMAERVIVSEKFLKKQKENGTYAGVDSLLLTAEDMNAKITILTSEEPCKKLDSLGGIAGTTRWKIQQ